MKRAMRMMFLAAILGGCVFMGAGEVLGTPPPQFGCSQFGAAPEVPGVMGPWGTPIPMAAPYSAMPPGEQAAYAMMSQSVPLSMVQQGNQSRVVLAGMQSAGGMPMGGGIAPPGVPYAPGMPGQVPPPGAVAAVGAGAGSAPAPYVSQRTQVLFTQPMDMRVSWFGPAQNGQGAVVGSLTVRGRYNFNQGGIYRLKLSNIPNYPSLDLYPTLEVAPANMKTAAFLAHSAVPLAFTEEDFAQVVAGNYVVKVIYLPDPQFQELAATAPGEIVSTALQPGVDPIAEAARQGSVLLVVRLSNIDLEAKNTPPMTAPNPYCAPPAAAHPQMGPGAVGGVMVPYGMQNSGQAVIMGRGLQPLQMTPQGLMPMHDNNSGGQFLPPSLPAAPAGPAVPTSSASPYAPATPSASLSNYSPASVQQASLAAQAANAPSQPTDSTATASTPKPGFFQRLFGSKKDTSDMTSSNSATTSASQQ